MSHRSSPFHKLKNALRQTPATHAAPKDAPRPLRVVPPSGGMPVRPRPQAGAHAETRLMDAVREADAEVFLTRELPKVSPSAVLPPYSHARFVPMSQRPAPPLPATRPLPRVGTRPTSTDSATTQVLPQIPAQAALPPSARHANPAAWHARTHAEDEWSDMEVAESRGHHVLAQLTAEPDVITAALVAVQQRAHAVLDVYDPMRRAEVAAQANDERMRAFAAKWGAWEARYEREFETWAKQFKKDLDMTQAAWAKTSGQTDADRLALGMSGTNTVVAGMLEAARMRVELDAMLAADEQVSA